MVLEYMSIPEAARLWSAAPTALRRKCEEKRILGAVRFGYKWLIPAGAQCPFSAEESQTEAAR